MQGVEPEGSKEMIIFNLLEHVFIVLMIIVNCKSTWLIPSISGIPTCTRQAASKSLGWIRLFCWRAAFEAILLSSYLARKRWIFLIIASWRQTQIYTRFRMCSIWWLELSRKVTAEYFGWMCWNYRHEDIGHSRTGMYWR